MIDYGLAIKDVALYRNKMVSIRDALNEGETVSVNQRTDLQIDYEVLVRPHADAVEMHEPGEKEWHGHTLKFNNPVEWAVKENSFFSLNNAIVFLNRLLGRLEYYKAHQDQFLPAHGMSDAPPSVSESVTKDVFLSHSHADKDQYVRPFARELDRRAISYWLDEGEIRWGDKISAKINEGLGKSEFVVVFLTDSFVGRNWPEAELAAAINRENAEGRTVVLPILIGPGDELFARYPLLRDKAYLRWELGAGAIADELQNLADRRWGKSELDRFILANVDLDQFPKGIWGPGRLLTQRVQFDEGAYFF